MNRRAVYLDSSAILKLVYTEDETEALELFLRAWPRRASSAVSGLEVMRIARRVENALAVQCARSVLDRIDLISVDEPILRSAMTIEPRSVRSMDAIHLATATALQPEVAGMVVYDNRLAHAARGAGITVWAPA